MARKLLVILLSFNCIFFNSSAEEIAFPGAEGHGRFATGGRGGNVYIITSLDDNPSNPKEGTLRHAVNASGSRTIVFAISGTINLKSNLTVSKDNITIAGQTAPGDGICLAGFPVSINANNVILRFIRCRMGDLSVTDSDGADALGGRGKTNIIVDHCSMSWSSDECVSFYGNTNFTLQWCIISESLRLSGHSKGPHGYGGIWGGVNASFHHNLLAHNDSRNPRLGPDASTMGREKVDLRNNVIYNWSGNSCYGGEGMNANIVNCFYKPGPASPYGTKRGKIISIDKSTTVGAANYNKWGKFYIDGNVVNDEKNDIDCINATNNNWTYGVYNQFTDGYDITQTVKDTIRASSPFDFGVVTTHTALKAYEKVLDYAGCSLKRDSVDFRIINETKSGTAEYKGLSKYNGLGTVTYPAGTLVGSSILSESTTINWKSTNYPKQGIIDSQQDLLPAGVVKETWSAWPELKSLISPQDTDKDGMPDEWESYNGLSSTNSSDRNSYTLNPTFTNLEVYINSMVATIINNQTLEAISSFQKINEDFSKVKLIKNPVIDYLDITSNTQMNEINVFSANGFSMYKFGYTGNHANILVNSLTSGLYLVDIRFDNGEKKLLKFIKK